jgi:hypothetical protein
MSFSNKTKFDDDNAAVIGLAVVVVREEDEAVLSICLLRAIDFRFRCSRRQTVF